MVRGEPEEVNQCKRWVHGISRQAKDDLPCRNHVFEVAGDASRHIKSGDVNFALTFILLQGPG